VRHDSHLGLVNILAKPLHAVYTLGYTGEGVFDGSGPWALVITGGTSTISHIVTELGSAGLCSAILQLGVM
jgi:hypothetical protein